MCIKDMKASKDFNKVWPSSQSVHLPRLLCFRDKLYQVVTAVLGLMILTGLQAFLMNNSL